jgi:hypothetical protein
LVCVVIGACSNPAPATDEPEVGFAGDPASCESDAAARSLAPPRASEAGGVEAATGAGGAGEAEVDRVELAAAGPVDASCSSAGAGKEGACKAGLPGVYGVQVDFDAYWMDALNETSPAFDPGRGTFRLILVAEVSDVCRDGSGGPGVIRVCGMRFPTLYADANGGVIQMRVNDPFWDRLNGDRMPTMFRATGFAPGDSLSFDAVAPTFGIELPQDDAAWPSYRQTPFLECGSAAETACFPDQDGDGYPGITVDMQLEGEPPQAAYPHCGGWRYTPAPTGFGPLFVGTGADRLYLGMRTQLRGSFGLGSDCAGDVGTAEASDIMLRVMDCRLTNGSACSPAQATIVDQHAPVFHVLKAGQTPPPSWRHPRADADAALDRSASSGPRIASLRLGAAGEAVSCPDARAAF